MWNGEKTQGSRNSTSPEYIGWRTHRKGPVVISSACTETSGRIETRLSFILRIAQPHKPTPAAAVPAFTGVKSTNRLVRTMAADAAICIPTRSTEQTVRIIIDGIFIVPPFADHLRSCLTFKARGTSQRPSSNPLSQCYGQMPRSSVTRETRSIASTSAAVRRSTSAAPVSSLPSGSTLADDS